MTDWGSSDGAMMALIKCVDPRDEETLRQFAMLAEYYQRRTVGNGGYRYFRSPNIVPIEHYRLSEPSRATHFWPQA
jgi:hypothetical protein